MSLSKLEEQFLAEKLEDQRRLKAQICEIRKDLEPLEKEYDSIQETVDTHLADMKVIAAKQNKIIEDTGLFALKEELADVAQDVTKLLRKQRK